MIPDSIHTELEAYRTGQHPYPFGSFITAVLANDFVGAIGTADRYNLEVIHAYASYLYNKMPARTGDPTRDIWGSYEAVKNTIERQAQRAAQEEEK